MPLQKKPKTDLEKKCRKVLRTPASFAFFVAIHDFIKCIELNSALSAGLTHRIDINKDAKLPVKYGYLKQIYQGVRDSAGQSRGDLGHDRYMTVNDLRRIQNNETSENNSFWKKRELFRKLTAEVYERLNINLAEVESE